METKIGLYDGSKGIGPSGREVLPRPSPFPNPCDLRVHHNLQNSLQAPLRDYDETVLCLHRILFYTLLELLFSEFVPEIQDTLQFFRRITAQK